MSCVHLLTFTIWSFTLKFILVCFFFNLNVYKEVLVNVTVFKKIKLNVLPYHKINFWLSEESLFVSFVSLPFLLICASLSSFPFLNIVIYNVSELCDVVICGLLSICLFP